MDRSQEKNKARNKSSHNSGPQSNMHLCRWWWPGEAALEYRVGNNHSENFHLSSGCNLIVNRWMTRETKETYLYTTQITRTYNTLTWNASGHMVLSTWCPDFRNWVNTPWNQLAEMNLEIIQVESGISLKEKEVYCGCLKKDMLIILMCVWWWGWGQGLENREHNKGLGCVHDGPSVMGLTFFSSLLCTTESASPI